MKTSKQNQALQSIHEKIEHSNASKTPPQLLQIVLLERIAKQLDELNSKMSPVIKTEAPEPPPQTKKNLIQKLFK